MEYLTLLGGNILTGTGMFAANVWNYLINNPLTIVLAVIGVAGLTWLLTKA